MLKSYIRIALRNIWKNRTFASINILGLALGIATCVIILLFVRDELRFDRFHKKADSIVRVYFKGHIGAGQMKEPNVFPPVAHTLKNDYPEVLDATRLRQAGMPFVTVDNHKYRDLQMAYVDSNFFSMFSFHFLIGNPSNVLEQPNNIVISKRAAEKYFGSVNAIGKILSIDDKTTFRVSGVLDNIPAHSHIQFDLFSPLSSVEDARSDSWMTSNYYTYLQLPENYDYRILEKKLPGAVEKYMGPQIVKAMGITLQQFRKSGNDVGIFLQPLTDIHLHSDFSFDLSAPGDLRYVYIFSIIAVFMLLIACINFMNLSTAGANARAREVGIRKVLGSDKKQLVIQFMCESLAMTFVAMILAIGAVQLALPAFNELSGKQLQLNIFHDSNILLGLMIIGLCTGILSGTYPAFFLSSFKPVVVLKGKLAAIRHQGFSLRNILVVFQFSVSIILMVCTVVVFQQLSYITEKKLGYDRSQVMVVAEPWLLGNQQAVFMELIAKDSRVLSVTSSGYLPAGPSYGNNFLLEDKSNSKQLKTLNYNVYPDFLRTLGIKLLQGRNFTSSSRSDSSSVLINETTARMFGWKDQILGRTLVHGTNEGMQKTYQVIGLVQDFHFHSLRERISPMVMTLGGGEGSVIIKLSGNDISGVVNSIQEKWKSLNQDATFQYAFLNDLYQNTYRAEKNTGKILAIFSFLTIFVGCLGLLALATFTARQRAREIGIRKVLGASIFSISTMLSKDFLRLIIIAFAIAAPVAWLAMNKWLQEFAYRIEISWGVFALNAMVTVMISLITVSYQSLKAGRINPVDTLKDA